MNIARECTDTVVGSDVFNESGKRPNSCILDKFDDGQSARTYCPNKKYNDNHRKLHK